MTTDDTSLTVIEEQADASIRRIWHHDRWYFSILDVVALLTDAPRPSVYWAMVKKRAQSEGFTQLLTKCERLKLTATDGKQRLAEAADTETLLRLMQSIPSPKAEPVKQWLAKVGAERLQEVTQPLSAPVASQEIAELRQHRPEHEASAMAWADYHAAMATLYRRQAAYEAQLLYVDAKLTEHDEQIGELHSRVESNEALLRMVPELLERLGPQALTSEHQATVKALAGRSHDLARYGYSTIYGDLNTAFHVGKYSDIRESEWLQVAQWFQQRIEAAQKRRPR